MAWTGGMRVGVSALASLADLALPATCAGCGEPGVGWCAPCAVTFGRGTALPLRVAGPAGTVCGPHGVTVAAASYEGVVRSAVVAFKDHGRRDLAPVLVPAMRAAVVAALTTLTPTAGWDDVVVVVPAPSTAAARRRRGDVPTHDLARAALTGVEGLAGRACLWAPVLRHRRRVADQAGLDRDARRRNVTGALTATPQPWLRGRTVLVVDDVVTTGATAAECVRVLGALGARPLALAALAATPRARATPAG